MAQAEKMLLVITARAGRSGQTWNAAKQEMSGRGAQPTTIEVIHGEIALRGLVRARELVIKPLDGAGNPMRRTAIQVENGAGTFRMGRDATVWYYLSVGR